MYLDAIKYRDGYIAKGSHAYALYHDKSDAGHKKLDKHLKELTEAKRKLES